MSLVLGIDTSTTATKAILVDRSGVVKGVASATYGYETPQPLWSGCSRGWSTIAA